MSKSKSPKFDPVVHLGLFRVDYKEHKRIYHAVDIAEAKYQLAEEFDLFPEINDVNNLISQKELRETILKSMKVWTLRKTVRQSDVNRAKRQNRKLDRTSG